MDLNSVLNVIYGVFSLGRPPLAPLAPPLVTIGAVLRPGLSASEIASNIIDRQSDAGAPVGALPDGSQSVTEAMELIRIQEIILAIQTQAKIDVEIKSGIAVQTYGTGNLGLPVVSFGTTQSLGIGQGIIR
jgi:hypothetical protein